LTTVGVVVPCPPRGALRRRIAGGGRETASKVIGPVPPKLWAPRTGGGMGGIVITTMRNAAIHMVIPELTLILAARIVISMVVRVTRIAIFMVVRVTGVVISMVVGVAGLVRSMLVGVARIVIPMVVVVLGIVIPMVVVVLGIAFSMVVGLTGTIISRAIIIVTTRMATSGVVFGLGRRAGVIILVPRMAMLASWGRVARVRRGSREAASPVVIPVPL
jgi:hypothetical protein